MDHQQLIQAARQYEPDNEQLVEAGDLEETLASLPVALSVLQQHAELRNHIRKLKQGG